MLNSLVNQRSYRNSYSFEKRNRKKFSFAYGTLLFALLGVLFLAGQGFFVLVQESPDTLLSAADISGITEILEEDFTFLPGATYRPEQAGFAQYFQEGSLFLAWASPLRFGELSVSMGEEAPLSQAEKAPVSVFPSIDKASAEDILAASGKLKDMAPIGIYCTHTTESYIPTYGEAKASGSRGGIYEVALALKDSLEKRGIPAVVSDTIHDYPDWEKSYSNSLQTMQEMKKKYPGMEMFIDVHRDALDSDNPLTTEINGEEVTKLMLVVGSNKRSNHPNWEQNLAFARKIGNALENSYPGILRSVRVQSGRYNQHMSPKSILVEVGCSNSSLEQAKRGVDYLADSIVQVLLAEHLETKEEGDLSATKEQQTGAEKTEENPAVKKAPVENGLLDGASAMEMLPVIE